MSRARKCSGASGLSLLLTGWAEELKMLALFMFKRGEQKKDSMKNQWFGDENDLFKFDLIEAILKENNQLNIKKFLYIPMLTKDKKQDKKPWDDNHRLKEALHVASKKDVCKFVKEYFSKTEVEVVEDLLDEQLYEDYFENVKAKIQTDVASLIFLDPDTGLIPPSKKKGNEYVYLETAKDLYNKMNHSSILMMYQHGRGNFKKQLGSKLKQLKNKIETLENVLSISYFKSSPVAFLFLTRNNDIRTILSKIIEEKYCNYDRFKILKKKIR